MNYRMFVSAVALAAGSVTALAGFTPDSIIVSRVGDGTATLGNAAARTSLLEWDGVSLGNELNLSTGAAGSRLTSSGSASSEGALTRSADGRYLTIGGYNAAIGTSSVVGTTSAATNRTIARVDFNQSATFTNLNAAFSANNIRSAVSNDGSQFYAAGANSGVQLATTGPASTQVNTTGTNLRIVNIFNGDLYFSTGSATPGVGIWKTTGLPGSSVAFTQVLSLTGSPYDYWFADANTLYVTDDSGGTTIAGVRKYVNSGSGFTLASSIFLDNAAATAKVGARGLTGRIEGGQTVLYATTAEASANRLIRIVDGSTPSVSTLATAGANFLFRGVELAPVPTPGALALAGVAGALAFGRRRK